MTTVTKEILYDIMVKQFEFDAIDEPALKEKCLLNLKNIIDQLYDCSRMFVDCLNEKETYLLREKYGMFEGGICLRIADLSKRENIPTYTLSSILNVACRKIKKHSVTNIDLENNSYIDTDGHSEENVLSFLSIDELKLSSRSYKCLKRVGLNNVGDVLKLTRKEIAAIKNAGRKSIREIIEVIHNYGLRFRDERDILSKKTEDNDASGIVVDKNQLEMEFEEKEAKGQEKTKEITKKKTIFKD